MSPTASPAVAAFPVVDIDFGTTNSVVAVLQPDGAVRTARAPGLEVFRTVLCFWAERGALRHAAGPHAVAAYLDDPENTRLIMSMKTYLAQRSFSSTHSHRGLQGRAALPTTRNASDAEILTSGSRTGR